jgi:hypothetical protein
MVEIHTNGWTKTIYDKGERENCQVTMFYTFEDRFEALRELLHVRITHFPFPVDYAGCC